jgi:hypothetical protein
MEAQNCGLACRVVCHPSYAKETRATRNSHNMTLVFAQHVRQESFGGVPVAEHIDIEDLPEIVVGSREDCVTCQYTGVVDEDTWCTECFLDFFSGRVDCGGIRDVAGEELDVGTWNTTSVSESIGQDDGILRLCRLGGSC